jgi:PAS domain S-box-containing protein
MRTIAETVGSSALRADAGVETQPGAALKILIIDDDPVDRGIFKQYLDVAQGKKFHYAEAESGHDGLKHVESFQPDCVLLDLNLPDMDGLQIIRKLCEPREFLPCAVVMLTGTGSERIAVEAMKLGAMDYLPKGPASAQTLPVTVASAIQRFRLQQQIADQRRVLEERNRELEAMRAELFDEKERYRTLAEAIPQLVWIADSEGRVHYANYRLWRFIGKEPDAKPEAAWMLTGLVHTDDRTELGGRWKEAVGSGRSFETEVRLQRDDDRTWRWHLMRTVPMRPNDEGPVRWFGTFTDIEDQRRAAEALRQRQKLDSIGLLAGGIAHDFNNLLVGIMGGASFAMEALEQSDPIYPMLEIVFRSSEKAAHLTRQLLAYSGKGQAYSGKVDISRVARETGDLLRASIPNSVTLTIQTDDAIPLIESNSSEMEQVLINLVMNAAEAIETPPGLVTVRTAVEWIATESMANVLGETLPAGEFALIEVSDTGTGMDEHTQTQIFDPFFTTKFMGRGLGLAAVQGIVRSLGGGIQVRSAIGQGSCIRVLLPVRAAVEKKKLVLLIENDAAVAGAAASLLTAAGREVLTCASESGLEVFAMNSGKVDLVVLNDEFPGWKETMAGVRALSAGVEVAILTASPSKTEGGVHLIEKPITTASVDQILNSAGGHGATA